MNVYMVTPSDAFYGQYDGIIIIAENEKKALEIAYKKDNSWYQYNTGGNLPDYTERHVFEDDQYPLRAEKIDLTKENVAFTSFLED